MGSTPDAPGGAPSTLNMRTIGFAGTAKNTGKTTTAQAVIQASQAAGLVTALTSIGYDGENKDNVTGLPKPRYFLQAGTYLATAESCLRSGSAGFATLVETDIQTILGRVIIARIVQPGYVLLAGPNRKDDLRTVTGLFQNIGIDLLLVDGALNRIVPLIGSDGLVISTGAALEPQIQKIAEHARSLCDLFLPVCTHSIHPAHQPGNGQVHLDKITLIFREGANLELSTGSLLSENTQRFILDGIKGEVAQLVVPGACDPHLFAGLLRKASSHLDKTRFTFGDPLKLAASGHPAVWSRFFREVGWQNHRVTYLEKVPLQLLTVNPFYPRYLGRSGLYEAAEVDKVELLRAVRDQINELPVVDIRQTPSPDLLGLLMD